MDNSVSFSVLFDSTFLARLERLQLLARRVHAGQSRAERRSHHLGSSLEFADYREYTPGDDLRAVDWNIYGRSDRMFLKLYEEEEDLHVYLLVDASASMRWTPAHERTGEPIRASKLDLGRRMAAALAYVGLANLDRVNVYFFGETLGADLGLGRGKSHFHRALRFLDRLPAETGPTNLARSLRAFGQKTKRRGLAMILSDFLDPRGYDEALSHLLYQRFEIQLIQLLDPAELNPRLRGDLRLTDAETGNTYEVTANEGLLRAYDREVTKFLGDLEAFCRKRAIGYRRATTDQGFDDIVLRLLRAGGGLAG